MNIHLHSCDLFSIRTLKLDKLRFIIGFSTSFATCIEPPISNYLIYIHKMYKINNSGRSLNVEHDEHKYLHIYWHRNFLNLPLFCRKLLLLKILYKCRSNIIWEKKKTANNILFYPNRNYVNIFSIILQTPNFPFICFDSLWIYSFFLFFFFACHANKNNSTTKCSILDTNHTATFFLFCWQTISISFTQKITTIIIHLFRKPRKLVQNRNNNWAIMKKKKTKTTTTIKRL